jgi:hypothetical protein
MSHAASATTRSPINDPATSIERQSTLGNAAGNAFGNAVRNAAGNTVGNTIGNTIGNAGGNAVLGPWQSAAFRSRRDWLRLGAESALAAAVLGGAGNCFPINAVVGQEAAKSNLAKTPKRVAGVVTTYYRNSHADVILTKILEGWRHDGGPGPALELAAVYIDQRERSEFGLELCKKHQVPVFTTIGEAVTAGGDSLAVDGVLSIGEHGRYPNNAIGQTLYPRRRFLEEIAAACERYSRPVPVFNDKHLGPEWGDAKWMYDRTRQLRMPFMAGSSLPVGFRGQAIDLPLGSSIEAAVGIGYGGLEAYGFHALEFYQWHVERRRGAERGVKRVRFLEGPEMWRAIDDGFVSKRAFDAAFAAVPKSGQPDPRKDEKAGLYLFEYLDGFQGAVFHLGCARGTAVGLTVAGQPEPLAATFDERSEPRYPHFAYLLKAIEAMMHSGRPAYPVERTLLTSGILDRGLNSRAQHGRWLDTPELSIAYDPVDYPYGQRVDLLAEVAAPPRPAGGR